MPSPKSQEIDVTISETNETAIQDHWTPSDEGNESLQHNDGQELSAHIVEFNPDNYIHGEDIVISQDVQDASESLSSHGVHYVQQIGLVQIDSSGMNSGEIRYIRLPVSLLPSNFQHRQPELQEQSGNNGNTNSELSKDNCSMDTEEVPVVEVPSPVPVEEDEIPIKTELPDSEDVKEEHESPLPDVEKPALNILTRPKRTRTKNRYLNSKKTLENKSSDQTTDTESKSVVSLKSTKTDCAEKNREKTTKDDDVTPPPPELFPKDRCANCMQLFANDQEKLSKVLRNSHKMKQIDDLSKETSKSEVSIMEALHSIFQIPKEEQVNDEGCSLCKKCANILEVLYSAYEDFIELTEKEGYVLKKLKEVSAAINSKGKKGGKRRKQSEPKKVAFSGSDELVGSQVDDEIDWDDEDDELITGDISDDEDFEPPPDIAGLGAESSSSSSDDETYSPVKKKKLNHRPTRLRSRMDDNFFWDAEIKEEPFSSDEEFGGTKRKQQPKSRIKKSTLRGLTYDCNLCDGSFQKPRELRKHLQEFHRKTHNSANDTLDQSTEESEEKKSQEANDSVENSDLNSTDLLKCRLCKKKFENGNALKDHFAANHEGELPFMCTKCDRSFTEESTLRRHLQSHTVETPYKCRLCLEAFRRADDLRTHWAETHGTAEDETVDSSDDIPNKKKRKSSGKKQKSKRVKVEKTVVPCEVCGKGFVRHDHLKLHMRVHTGEKPFPCNVCGKAFSDPRGLAYHEVTHSNERPYCCTICGMTFKRLHHLNDHERNHREDVERPFACEMCGKCFKYKKHLNSHLVIHGDSKDYQCEICGKAFNRKDNLRQHVKKVHGKEPGPSTMSFPVTTANSTTSGQLIVTTSSPTNNSSIVTQAIPLDGGLDLVYMTL